MSNKDHIIRVSAANNSVRGFFADTTNTVNEASQIHDCTPVVAAGLGRLLTAAVIMGQNLKNDGDLITVYIKGNGPMGGITVTTNNKGEVKGFPYESHVLLPLNEKGKLDVSKAIGDGILTVVKDLGLKEPFIGKVELVSGEIGEDIANYLHVSEQISSAVSLGVLVDVDHTIKHAGGFIIELLPDCDEDIRIKLEDNILKMSSITTLLEDGLTTEDIAKLVFDGFDINITEKVETMYYCNCNREKVTKALIATGREELQNIIEQDKKAEIKCHFCKRDYHFDEKELKSLLNS